MSGAVIVERSDIHKSCISIEAVVNILNDYCEAANAIVTIQKKLAKALRESASAKGTTEIAANAFNASATIFESLVEVDSKFVKFADRECDNISAEVKKWFKKLAKEEKAHDQRMATANAKIKQAGQLYEKKAKKNPRDVQEEHTRYITLLSSLGPEVAQDKHNHSVNVTKRHIETLYSLASSLSRVADGEWLRTCEGVRRFGPTIGQLGQWRSLCEGGWTGPVPQDLPVTQPEPDPRPQEMQNLAPPLKEQLSQQSDTPELLERPAPEYTSRGATPTGTMKAPPNYTSQTASEGGSEKDDNVKDRSRSATSLPSLASFPSPPTHFPLPPTAASVSSHDSIPTSNGEGSRPPQEQSLEPNPVPDVPKAISSPIVLAEKPASSTEFDPTPSSSKKALEDQQPAVSLTSDARPSSSNAASSRNLTRSIGENVSSSNSATDSTPGSASGSRTQQRPPSQPVTQEDHSDAEFGVRKPLDVAQQSATLPATKVVDRDDTGRSTGSVVANLRDKYSRSSGPPSPGPKEVPRLPLSVSNLAHRYESSSNHSNSSQLNMPRSPTEERRRVSSDLHVRPSNIQHRSIL
ncbi:hypothetical protein QCA50_018451 [Cerrena zonata]|uniref:Uncharacterized protein n=1 Tax=Cerrena zonata TaxID=2478898 RepID=A0AAW0FK74_9APHY